MVSFREVKCPKCGKKAVTLPPWIESYFDPKFVCKFKNCGYKGKLSWSS